jgi:hypothetical protein
MNHHFDTLRFLALERIAELRQQTKHDGLLNRGWIISKLWKRIRPGDPQPKPAPSSKPPIKPVPQQCSLEAVKAGD